MRNAVALMLAVGATLVAVREVCATCVHGPQVAPAQVVALGCPVRIFTHHAQPIADPRLVVDARGVDVTGEVTTTMVELAVTDHAYVANSCEETTETFPDVFERHEITLDGAEVGDVVRLANADPGHAPVTFTISEAGPCPVDPQPAGYHCHDVRKDECDETPAARADSADEIAGCSTTAGSSSALAVLGVLLARRRRRAS